MKYFPSIRRLLATLLIATTSIHCFADTKEKAWIALFDGKTLAGWTPNAGDQKISLNDGMIQILSVRQNLWLTHETVFKNFELITEIKATL